MTVLTGYIHRTVPRLVRTLLVLLLLVVAVAGAGTAAAAGQQNGPCPGENPNVGLEHADELGETHSLRGIGTAFRAIGCGPSTVS